MLCISNLTLPPDGTLEQLRQQAAAVLGVSPSALQDLKPVRTSIDARRGRAHWVCSVEVSLPDEAAVAERAPGRGVSLVSHVPYVFPPTGRRSTLPPVVVGMGPAGLFAALFLARNGIPSILLERGQDVARRRQDVARFWNGGSLDPESNVQFGEGGAGTFSDGKLTTGTHDPRIAAVLDTFVGAGAPEDIRWSHRPHIGTDILCQVIRNLRLELQSLGCDVRFGHRLKDVTFRNGALSQVEISTPQGTCHLDADTCILAPGHSARDTFVMLRDAGVPMERKSFAIGVRVEHLQRDISRQQYGSAWRQLPPSDYRLACHLPDGRSVFSFCVCPGGQVVAAASEPGCLVTNGMSLRARDGENINGALLVNVTPDDFPAGDVLSGVRFQQQWEQAAFRLGGGSYCAPAQRMEDFLRRRPSRGAGGIRPTYLPGVTWTSLDGCLPDYVTGSLRQAIPLLDRKLKGFSAPDAVLSGVETRSSSPVRILRGPDFQSPLSGLYPCGEGAGYAGGIVSAAVDGIRVAEAVARG